MSDRNSEFDSIESHIRRSWEVNAAAWTETVRGGRIESRRVATDEAIVAAVLRYGVGRVLDVGCGEGWLARALSGRGVEVTGVDGSAALIERARELGGGRFEVHSYEQIVADRARLWGPYEGIVCNFALLGADLAPLLSALRSHLAATGHLFIQTVHPFTASGDGPYVDGWRTETFSSFGGTFQEAMPWYFRTVGSWMSEVQRGGLRVVECEEPVHPETGRPLSLLMICAPE